jgi:hypothetical protein
MAIANKRNESNLANLGLGQNLRIMLYFCDLMEPIDQNMLVTRVNHRIFVSVLYKELFCVA